MKKLWEKIRSADKQAWMIATGAFLLLFLVCVFASPVMAASAEINGCTPPVTRADNSPLAADEIQHYNWYVDGVVQMQTPVCEPMTITADVADGDHQVYATTVDTDNRESAPSNTVIKSFTTANPNPPTLQ